MLDHMLDALARLKEWFGAHLPAGRLPQIVFHGAEPLLNREAVFAGIERYAGDFSFGVQTNATNLDEAAIDFLTSHKVGIGLSLDAPTARIAVADLAAPGELLERARTALRAADPTRAAVDLAVVLRLEPGLAPAILDLLALTAPETM